MRSPSFSTLAGALALSLATVLVLGAARRRGAEPGAAEVPPAVLALAKRTLAEMQSAPPDLAATFGLANADEARQARLGTPVREVVVPLDALRGYQAKTPVEKLFTGGTTYLFPVLVGTDLRSSLRLQAVPGAAPKILGMGGTEVLTQLARLPEVAARLRTAGGTSVTAVRVPALGLYFAARRAGGVLELASPFDVPNEKLKSGSWEPAEALFTRLAASARALPKGAM